MRILRNDAEKAQLEEEFTQLYKSYRTAIYKFCLTKLSYESRLAEDCMQNAFVALYKKMLSGEEIHYHRAFLYKAANRYVLKCINENKKYQKRHIPLEEYETNANDAQYLLDGEIDYRFLKSRLEACLNENELELLKLKYIDDLTIEQTAQILNISQTAAAKRLQRLREKIKQNIDYKEGSDN